ncbi:MAG TPA: hypothetical protein VFS00_21150, partial [Polyangiaceae bacterium]|nr:hypothetical protein [Polyangiaceae bacterium]
MLTAKRLAERRKTAAEAAASALEADQKASAAEAARRLSTPAILAAVLPLGESVDISGPVATCDAYRERLSDLRGAFKRAEGLLDEDLADGADEARIARRRARVEALRADIVAAEHGLAESEVALRAAALGQLGRLREAGLRAVSAEGLEALLEPEAKEAAALYAKLVPLAARAVEKVLARRADVGLARLAVDALAELGEAPSARDDAKALRTLGEV